jgi:hypothetical protein
MNTIGSIITNEKLVKLDILLVVILPIYRYLSCQYQNIVAQYDTTLPLAIIDILLSSIAFGIKVVETNGK